MRRIEVKPVRKHKIFRDIEFGLWVDPKLVSFELTKHGVKFYVEMPVHCDIHEYDDLDAPMLVSPPWYRKGEYQLLLLEKEDSYRIEYGYDIYESTDKEFRLILAESNKIVEVENKIGHYKYQNGEILSVVYHDKDPCSCKEDEDCVCY